MKTWFTSLNGAITLSFAALLIELFRGFIDAMFVYPREFPGTELTIAFGYLVIFGIWIRGLLAASNERRWGIVAAFAVGLFAWLAQDWMAILVYCAPLALSCNSIWSMIAAWAGLVIGALALIALGLQIWRKRVPVTQ